MTDHFKWSPTSDETVKWTKPRKSNSKWRNEQRRAALAALPLAVVELRAMFDMLDTEIPRRGCDHTRRLAREWLVDRGHDVQRVFDWLDTQGASCDCEIVLNVPEKVDEATRAEE